VEQDQVGPEVVPLHIEVHLAADEREAAAELHQRLLQPVHQGLLDVTAQGAFGQVQEVDLQHPSSKAGVVVEAVILVDDDLLWSCSSAPLLIERGGARTRSCFSCWCVGGR
jgi:hypothetical protein